MAECVARNRERLHFSTELAPALEHARLLFVAVGTPPTYSGDADLSAVHAVVDAMPASDHHALVMKSTVPVGTGAAIKRTFVERGEGGLRLRVLPRVPQGGLGARGLPAPTASSSATTATGPAMRSVELYAPLDAPLVRTDIASAEMIKLAANAFLATKISFINEIANVCEETGADVLEVARGMGLDQRIGTHFLKPGIGFGGSCFPKDVSALKQLAGNSGYHFQLLTAVIEVNELQKRRVVGKLQKHLGSLVGQDASRCSDSRSSPTPTTCARPRRSCWRRGFRPTAPSVRAYDPVAEPEAHKLMLGVEFADSALGAVAGADACVLVTEWPEFVELDWAAVAERDERRAGDRRSQLPRPRGGPGRRVRVRGHRTVRPD